MQIQNFILFSQVSNFIKIFSQLVNLSSSYYVVESTNGDKEANKEGNVMRHARVCYEFRCVRALIKYLVSETNKAN